MAVANFKLVEFVKTLARVPKLVVLDIGKCSSLYLGGVCDPNSLQITLSGHCMWIAM